MLIAVLPLYFVQYVMEVLRLYFVHYINGYIQVSASYEVFAHDI